MRSYLGFDARPVQVSAAVRRYDLAPHWDRLADARGARVETQEHGIVEFEGGQLGLFHWTDADYDFPPALVAKQSLPRREGHGHQRRRGARGGGVAEPAGAGRGGAALHHGGATLGASGRRRARGGARSHRRPGTADRALVDDHLRYCTKCRAGAETLPALVAELPELAEAVPDADFIARVLAATSGRPRRHAWHDRWLAWWVVSSLVARLRNGFRVSASEVGDHDLWRSACIGVAVVGNSVTEIEGVLQSIEGEIASDPRIEIREIWREIEGR